ncbi:segregation and condensation protein A [Actinomadura verrucosospora]|uniref:Segregation and condensation protein A n=1 Tax=Actinomadura verrucosospora TaxID=46165 RepID=A0A7D3VZJ2_ACTVE|nr:ScpA family protein [Actinomadura verrucosospora]QKG26770.1 chromosome segregation and condensation protein ScpA [Actinomadura verrucosospora]
MDETAPEQGAAPDRERDEEQAEDQGFRVHLDNFEGPFDLLLGLISKHKLDITEVSLHKVTDDFIAHIRSYGKDWDLDQASHFLLVAATLLDLKAARLLPSGEVDDEDDLALLEARDLLFARLLQYRAYKEVAQVLAARMADANRRFPRMVPMEPKFANLLPEVLLGLGPEEFARLAAKALAPKAPPAVSVEHMYQPKASVKEQAAIVVEKLRRLRKTTFRVLASDADGTYEVVARFLALLELYRERSVTFEQLEPLGELHVTWTGTDEGDVAVGDDYEGSQEARAAAEKDGKAESDGTDGKDEEDDD